MASCIGQLELLVASVAAVGACPCVCSVRVARLGVCLGATVLAGCKGRSCGQCGHSPQLPRELFALWQMPMSTKSRVCDATSIFRPRHLEAGPNKDKSKETLV